MKNSVVTERHIRIGNGGVLTELRDKLDLMARREIDFYIGCKSLDGELAALGGWWNGLGVLVGLSKDGLDAVDGVDKIEGDVSRRHLAVTLPVPLQSGRSGWGGCDRSCCSGGCRICLICV